MVKFMVDILSRSYLDKILIRSFYTVNFYFHLKIRIFNPQKTLLKILYLYLFYYYQLNYHLGGNKVGCTIFEKT